MKKVKIIFHIDLNAFFATCASLKEPYLKNKVFVVGGNASLRKGIISTASYNARKYGIGSGMSVADALNIYPKLVVVPLEFELYTKYSKLFFKYLANYSDLIFAGSIDEAYLDMTAYAEKMHPLALAKKIQNELLKEFGLPSSIGIAPTLFLAKMASDMKKPLGITVIRKKDALLKLANLPIENLFGIGKKTYSKLKFFMINSIGDFVAEKNKETVLKVLSLKSYYEYLNSIFGRSSDVVNPNRYLIPRSISNETTLNYPIDEIEVILEHTKELYDKVHKRMLKNGYKAKTFGIRLKDESFAVINRSKTVLEHTDDYLVGYEIIENLVNEVYNNQGIRLIGVFLNGIVTKEELKEEFNLFTYKKVLGIKD